LLDRALRSRPGSFQRAAAPRARLRAAVACALWAAGTVLAPLAHVHQHVQEARELDAARALAASARAAEGPARPTSADLAALAADPLGWEEQLFLAAEAEVPDEVDWTYGPLVAYELRSQSARESGLPHDDGSGHPHSHAFSPHSPGSGGHSHSHPGDSGNPWEHGQGSLAHSAVALHTPPATPVIAAIVPVAQSMLVSSASCESLPAWQRPRRAQSPPLS